MIYTICNEKLQSKYRLPANFDPFLLNNDKCTSSDLYKSYIQLDIGNVPIDVSHTKITHANIYNIYHCSDDSWVFMTGRNGEQMHLSPTYDHFEFYAPEISANFKPWLRDLRDFKISMDAFNLLLLLSLRCYFLFHDILSIHGACVELNGNSYFFSGISGAGKSTRAKHWVDQLGASWISGDRPNFNLSNRTFSGVPWDGKEGIYRNVSYPANAIFDVKRSDKLAVYQLSPEQAYRALLAQNFIPIWDPILTMKSLQLLRKTSSAIPAFRLYCNKDPHSACDTYDLITNHADRINPTIETIISDNCIIHLKEPSFLQQLEQITATGEKSVTTIITDHVVSKEEIRIHDVFAVNHTSIFLYNCLKKNDLTRRQLLNRMLTEYAVNEIDAGIDLNAWLEMMLVYGFLTVST